MNENMTKIKYEIQIEPATTPDQIHNQAQFLNALYGLMNENERNKHGIRIYRRE